MKSTPRNLMAGMRDLRGMKVELRANDAAILVCRPQDRARAGRQTYDPSRSGGAGSNATCYSVGQFDFHALSRRDSTSMVSPLWSLASPPFWKIIRAAPTPIATYRALVAPMAPSTASSASLAAASEPPNLSSPILF